MSPATLTTKHAKVKWKPNVEANCILTNRSTSLNQFGYKTQVSNTDDKDHAGNHVWGRRSVGWLTILSRAVLDFVEEPGSKKFMNRVDASFAFAHDILRLNNVRVCNMSKMGNS